MARKKSGDSLGQEIDSLYLSLGLDIADLELGFDTAEKTVKQVMSRLNSEAKQIQLKADIDIARLEAAGKPIDALKAKEKALNDELVIQQKKLEMLNRAYEANVKTFGKDDALTRGVDTKRLYQQRDIERLKASIAQVNAELNATGAKATGAFGKIGNAASQAKSKVDGIIGGIGKFNAAIAGASAAIAGGYGLFNITDKAMNAGENLYKLSTRLHTTTAEASKLSKVFQLAGVDINSVVPLFARIDKQALAAAKSENEMSQAMGEFGFSLTDSKGNLLSYEQQLSQLAGAYDRAVKAGKEAEFVTNVLGGKGAGLVPLLQEYRTNLEIVSRIKTTGLLNPKDAHELYIEWQAMQMQAGQLTGAVGQALMPVAKELMPEITEGFKGFAKAISDNKDSIKAFGSVAGDVLGGTAKMVVALASAVGDLSKAMGDLTSLDLDEKILSDNGKGGALDRIQQYLNTIGMPFLGLITRFTATKGQKLLAGKDWDKYKAYSQNLELEKLRDEEMADLWKEDTSQTPAISEAILKREKRAVEAQKKLEKELSETTNKRLKEQLEAIQRKVKSSIESGKTEQEAWIAVEQSIAEAIVNSQKQAKEANEELQKSIKNLSNSDLQNSLDAVDYSAKQSREKGASEELIQREAELKKQKIQEDFAKETAAYLDNIYADSFTQRLNQIEREKQAWIKKGLDEVQATRAAEEQKKQATNDSVKNMFTSQKKYLDLYRKAMRGEQVNGNFYDFTTSPEARQQQAIKAIQRQMMKEAGINPNERTSMAEIQGFQQVMKGAEQWGLSLLKGGGNVNIGQEMKSALSESNTEIANLLGQINTGVPEINSNLSQILSAIQSKNTAPNVNVSPTINVDLGGAYVFDDKMKKTLTDDITKDVANGVSQAAQQAFAESNYSYGG